MQLQPLNKVYVELTRACNLSCTHCLNSSGTAEPDELQYSEITNIINQLADLKAKEIRFTGGEPTIDRNLCRYISHSTENGIATSIGTNAVSITREVGVRLREAGLKKAIVSIDGNEASHDAVRGSGSYKRTLRGAISLRDACIDVRINAVAMRSTLYSLPELAETCAEQGLKLFIRRFIPSGRAKESYDQFLSLIEYAELKQSLSGFISSKVVEGHHFSDTHNTCSAGTTGFGINPKGEIYRCGFLDAQGDESFGNIRHMSLFSAWEAMQKPELLMQLDRQVEDLNRAFPERPKTNCPATGYTTNLVQIRRK